MFESNMEADSKKPILDEATAEFLRKKGSLEILVEIGSEGPRRHTDLREELLLSSSTVQKRLKKGKEHDLWEPTIETREGVDAKVHQLTDLGEALYSYAADEELPKLYAGRRGLIRSIEKRERKVLIEMAPDDADWTSDIPMEKYEIDLAQKFLSQF
jgi:DNA-binding MarR family transcriptional regulator